MHTTTRSVPGIIIGINGKAYAGKDTLAERLIAALTARGRSAVRVGFSDSIRVEAQAAVDQAARGDAVVGLKPSQAAELEQLMWAAAPDDFDLSVRTDFQRAVLQRFGMGWRPDGYWAARVVEDAQRLADAGQDVLLTGLRFPAETNLAMAAGATTIRLDISPAEQDRRAVARDGKPMADEARNHLGEIIQDGRDDWTLRIGTDTADADAVFQTAWAFIEPMVTDRRSA